MSKIDELIIMLNELEEIRLFKKYDELVNDNPLILEKFAKLKKIQKQLVNSKYLAKPESSLMYQQVYDQLKKELTDNIYVDQYLTFLDITNNLIKQITSIISLEINEKLK